jgi:hypothetical protein
MPRSVRGHAEGRAGHKPAPYCPLVAELVISMAPFTVAVLRRFPVYVDGRQVAKLRQGRSVRIEVEPGRHLVRAELDHQSGEFEVDVHDRAVEVLVEYAFLITDSHTDPNVHAFNFKRSG